MVRSPLSQADEQRLTAALLQGCMPRLFVPGLLQLVEEIVHEAVQASAASRSAPQVPALLQRQLPRGTEPLTPRERQWLQHLANGCTSEQMAERLCLAQSTAKTYASSVISKLQASHRSHAVAIALRHALIN